MSHPLDSLNNESFDFVILGTGLTESILSASLALQGFKVLHIDHEEYYGQDLASLSIDELTLKQSGQSELNSCSAVDGKTTDSFICTKDDGFECGFIQQKAFICDIKVLEEEKMNTLQSNRSNWREFNIDLNPRLILCRGITVEHILTAELAQCLEFQTVGDVFMLSSSNKVLQVPCTKSAVFKSKDFSMAEKRKLMKFLQIAIDNATASQKSFAGSGSSEIDSIKYKNEHLLNAGRSLSRPQNKPIEYSSLNHDRVNQDDSKDFIEYLRTTFSFSEKMVDFLLYTVCMLLKKPSSGQLSMEEGLRKAQDYLFALGRFGNTAFLSPVWGVSDIIQAFCRLSALKGTVFVLRHQLAEVLTSDDGDCRAVSAVKFASGQTVCTRNFICGSNYTLSFMHAQKHREKLLARLVLIADGPVVSFSSEFFGKNTSKPYAELLRAHRSCRSTLESKRCTMDCMRCAMIIPPNHEDIHNGENAIHVLQMDSSINASCYGHYVVHLSMECYDCESGIQCLETAAEIILGAANSNLLQVDQQSRSTASSSENDTGKLVDEPIVYLWKASFSFKIDSAEKIDSPVKGLTKMLQFGLRLDCQDYFNEAQLVFESLCPNIPLLTPKASDPNMEQGIRDGKFSDKEELLFLKSVVIPQPVDLQWYRYLGGVVGDTEDTSN